MLFMITSKHDYSTCQANHPENHKHFSDTLSNLGDHGIKVHAMYSNRLQHTAFIVCEADSMEQLDAGFNPILDYGNYEVRFNFSNFLNCILYHKCGFVRLSQKGFTRNTVFNFIFWFIFITNLFYYFINFVL